MIVIDGLCREVINLLAEFSHIIDTDTRQRPTLEPVFEPLNVTLAVTKRCQFTHLFHSQIPVCPVLKQNWLLTRANLLGTSKKSGFYKRLMVTSAFLIE